MSRPFRRMAAIAIGLLLALAAGEIACRIAGLDGRPDVDPKVLAMRKQARESSMFRRSEDPLLIYELRPSYSVNGQRLTEVGGILRETDVPVAKPLGVFRIVVLGDSISAMLGQRLHLGARPFPDLLEKILNRRPDGPRVEVLNFGTDGYGTLQEARLLETKAARYDPDLILIQYCYNDPGVNVTPAIWFLEPEDPVSYLVSFVASLIRDETAEDLDPRRSRLVPDIGPVTPEARRHWESLYEPDSASWERVVTGFEKIAAVARKKQVPVVFVAFPLLIPPGRSDPAWIAIQAKVLGTADRYGFKVVDLGSAFTAFPIEALQEFPGRDVYHPNAKGHAIAAKFIADHLRALDLFSQRR